MTGELLDCIVEIGRQLSSSGAAELAQAVEKSGSVSKLKSRADSLATVPRQKLARELVDAWSSDGSVTASSISAALLAAQSASEQERSDETVDLVWTGPKSTQVPVAMNAEALNEIVDAAKEHLLLVSYATYQVPALVQRLASAVERGVIVDLVLEFHGSDADAAQQWDPVAGLGSGLPDGVRIYEWPVDVREATENGKVGYLHVKCAVADSSVAFVSSANLTVYAMEMNMELGVVVRGGEVPTRIASHFAALIDDGVLAAREV